MTVGSGSGPHKLVSGRLGLGDSALESQAEGLQWPPQRGLLLTSQVHFSPFLSLQEIKALLLRHPSICVEVVCPALQMEKTEAWRS